VGAVGVLDQAPEWLLGKRLVSKALDNRLGAFVVLEALRLLKDQAPCEVVAVGTAQEEIGAYGARTAAFREAPDLALVVDVHHDSATPGMEKGLVGEAELGKGVVLDVGPFVDKEVLRGLKAAAEREGIPYVLHAHGSHSGTDADEVAKVREGIPTGIVSIPLALHALPGGDGGLRRRGAGGAPPGRLREGGVAVLTFKEAQEMVDAWIGQFAEGYFPPLLMLARLTEELGEVARVLAHRHGKTPKPGEEEGDLAMELADLLFVLISLANREGIDLEEAFLKAMEKYQKRDGARWTPKELE
jgi:NTP pyrophosphatase (non-canonical NTP hydrolase)